VRDPIELFREWFEAARAGGFELPEAMTLATADAEGRPSARTVLLKSADERGFAFFTNYESRKGRELAENPRAALAFHWQPLNRQARLEGWVERLEDEESDAYYASRPRGHRLQAWASRQGTAIPSRAVIDEAYAAADGRYPGEAVPRPPYWGGYRLVPDAIELWQGRPDRMHDRRHFGRRDDGTWTSERLSP
jgi:pyridoxamine 5'-phosphate oxidase